jgi:lysozyme
MKRWDEWLAARIAEHGVTFRLTRKFAWTGYKNMVEIMARKAFIEKMWPIAMEEFHISGIHPYVTISQSAHESGWGLSGLTRKANNLFGYTGESWQKAGKPTILLPTREYLKGQRVTVERPFRAYPTWSDSIRDWATNISTLSRYKDAYEHAKTGDVKQYARAVFVAGYATDPIYPEKLTNLYKSITNLLPEKEDIQGGQA